MASESDKQKAAELVAVWKADIGQVVKYERMESDIAEALAEQREECAKVAEATRCSCDDELQRCQALIGKEIAAAIRQLGEG